MYILADLRCDLHMCVDLGVFDRLCMIACVDLCAVVLALRLGAVRIRSSYDG